MNKFTFKLKSVSRHVVEISNFIRQNKETTAIAGGAIVAAITIGYILGTLTNRESKKKK